MNSQLTQELESERSKLQLEKDTAVNLKYRVDQLTQPIQRLQMHFMIKNEMDQTTGLLGPERAAPAAEGHDFTPTPQPNLPSPHKLIAFEMRKSISSESLVQRRIAEYSQLKTRGSVEDGATNKAKLSFGMDNEEEDAADENSPAEPLENILKSNHSPRPLQPDDANKRIMLYNGGVLPLCGVESSVANAMIHHNLLTEGLSIVQIRTRSSASENNLETHFRIFKTQRRKKCKTKKNPNVDTSVLPEKEREEKERREREQLQLEWLKQQDKIKEDKMSIISGHRTQVEVKKGNTVGQFFMAVKAQWDEVRVRGKSGPLFAFDVHDDVRSVNDASIETEESHAGKVVQRSWYGKNKLIFQAARWEVFDPAKEFTKYTIKDLTKRVK
ncbi:hypothetical protein HDU77_001513 [Chytriomyces hyalinus]|nr:hypothetical protein HDU77_001513 [Chytriomyces hyalinus]